MSDYPKLPDFNETNLWTLILKWRYAEMVHEIEEACIGVEGEISAMMHAYVDSDRAMRANDADDAARYRWLRDDPAADPCYVVDSVTMNPMEPTEMDAAIDAALQAEAQKKGGD